MLGAHECRVKYQWFLSAGLPLFAPMKSRAKRPLLLTSREYAHLSVRVTVRVTRQAFYVPLEW
jgi:hypothetical protein